MDNLLTKEINCDAVFIASPNTIIFPQSSDPPHDMCMSSSYVQCKLRSHSLSSVPKLITYS